MDSLAVAVRRTKRNAGRASFISPMQMLRELHQRRPLVLVPFLAPDNDEIGTTSYAWVERANEEFHWLLRLRFPRFASHLLFDPQLRTFLDTFLRFRRRHYDGTQSGVKVEALQQLDRRVLMLFVRISTGDLAHQGLSELVRESRVLSMPVLLDLSTLYGWSNSALLSTVFDGALALDATLPAQLATLPPIVTRVLATLDASASGAEAEAAADQLRYLADIAIGLGSLVRASQRCAEALAADADGAADLKALCLAWARTYEVTVPALQQAAGTGNDVDASFPALISKLRTHVVVFVERAVHVLHGDLLRLPGAEACRIEGLLSFVLELSRASASDDATAPPVPLSGALLGDMDDRFGLQAAFAAVSGRSDVDETRTAFVQDVLHALPRAMGATIPAPGGAGPGQATRPGAALSAAATPFRPNPTPDEAEMRRLAAEVAEMLPHLGLGFIEACLTFLDFSVERVVNAVLEDTLPPQVSSLDRQLDRYRVQQRGDANDRTEFRVGASARQDAELAAKQRSYVAQLERDADDEAFLLEYNDEKDDQYEGISSFDVALHPSEFEHAKVLKLNAAMRQAEAEEDFWLQMRNTNKPRGAQDGEEEGEAGGREEAPEEDGLGQAASGHAEHVPPRKALDHHGGGGRGGRGHGGGRGGGELSKLQKRRKQQNKGKAHRAAAARKQNRQGAFGVS